MSHLHSVSNFSGCSGQLRWAVLCLLVGSGSPVTAQFSGRTGFDNAKLKAIDTTLAEAVKRREIPGAIIRIQRNGKLWEKAYGAQQIDPSVKPMSMDTIFDAASLTKVMATAPAIMLLVEDGKLEIDAPASRWLPEFTGQGKEKITLRQMLTHVSGLRSGLLASTEAWTGYGTGQARAMAQEAQSAPGTAFRYRDLNFILLGEIVQRVSGESLAAFAKRRIFKPLSMADTTFLPAQSRRDRIAPTTREGDAVVHGIVHDPTSRRMGGVTGHAGLFTTSRDIARYCQMLLNGGRTASGKMVMKVATLKAMIAVQPPLPGGARRTLGFDVLTSYSDPKGAHFGPRSFGHTGWTGSCFWVDPESNSYFILMTNRNHPNEAHSVKNLRWEVSTLAAEALGVARRVMSGADRIASGAASILNGKKIGLITNQTGRTSHGKSTLTALQKIPGTKVLRLFSPEHGIAGKLDHDGIGDSIDESSGLPVTSLYGKGRKPTSAALAGIEVLVFDIQDIGTRFYTYISTMLNCMESAYEGKLGFVVLDRVNPLGGLAVEGPLPVDVDNTFVACHNIPIRHGLTIGELARLFVKERFPGLALTVVPMEGWQRSFLFPHTLAPWVNPSPNMRSPEAALLYPGIGLLEFSNLSVGRGTNQPFLCLGAPWINAEALVRRLAEEGTPGVRIAAFEFTPVASVCANELCHGISFSVDDARTFQPVRLGIVIARALFQEHGETFQLDKVNKLLFHPPTLQAIRAGAPLTEITARWKVDETAFRKRTGDVLLYHSTMEKDP